MTLKVWDPTNMCILGKAEKTLDFTEGMKYIHTFGDNKKQELCIYTSEGMKKINLPYKADNVVTHTSGTFTPKTKSHYASLYPLPGATVYEDHHRLKLLSKTGAVFDPISGEKLTELSSKRQQELSRIFRPPMTLEQAIVLEEKYARDCFPKLYPHPKVTIDLGTLTDIRPKASRAQVLRQEIFAMDKEFYK